MSYDKAVESVAKKILDTKWNEYYDNRNSPLKVIEKTWREEFNSNLPWSAYQSVMAKIGEIENQAECASSETDEQIEDTNPRTDTHREDSWFATRLADGNKLLSSSA